MTQRDRDRLVVLKKAEKKLITQQQAAEELSLSERQIRRMLVRLKEEGDSAVVHKLRGQRSNRRLADQTIETIVRVLSQEVYQGFGPTLASEHLRRKHKITIGRECLRKAMIKAGLWRSRKQRVESIHEWRPRRSCRGELVQWDTSTHDWLEGRGERLYLIHMIDDATSELLARFVRSDSTESNMQVLRDYLERNGRPVAFYTDKAALFQTTPRVPRDQAQLCRDECEPLPPTQIGRALAELGIAWIPAHSPQAKGRVERSFATAQDRLVKEMRVAGVRTLEQANRFLHDDFLPWWNQHLVIAAAHPADAHRPLGQDHDLAAILCAVEKRQVNNDYTIQVGHRFYQIERESVRTGLRGGVVRVERRGDGNIAVRFQNRYLKAKPCPERPKPAKTRPTPTSGGCKPQPSPAMRESMSAMFDGPTLPTWLAGKIDRTRTVDKLEE